MGQVTYSYRPEARLLAGQMLLTILSTQIAVIALISCFVFLRYMEVSFRVDATQLLYRLVRKHERKLGNVIKCLRGVGGRRSHRGSTGLMKAVLKKKGSVLLSKRDLPPTHPLSRRTMTPKTWRFRRCGIPAFNHDAGRAFILSPTMGGDQPIRIPLIG